MMKKLIFLISIIAISIFQAHAQKPYPQIGQPLPDHLLIDVVGYHKKTASFSEFKGKWLVIDLWSIYCGGCLASMPKMNELQKKYSEKLKIVMIGSVDVMSRNDKANTKLNAELMGKTKRTWDFMKKTHNLELTCAFDDSYFSFLQGTKRLGLPCILIVDPAGVLRWISHPMFSLESELEAFFIGKIPETPDYYLPMHEAKIEHAAQTFDHRKDVIGGADSSLFYRSLITYYGPEIGAPPGSFFQYAEYLQPYKKDHNANVPVQLCGKLSELLYYAFTGRTDFSSRPVILGDEDFFSKVPFLNVRDSSVFFDVRQPNLQNEGAKNIFCYNIYVPKGRQKNHRDNLLQMQEDLQRAFGIDVRLEKRIIPALALVVSDAKKGTKLKTKYADFDPSSARKTTMEVDGESIEVWDEPEELSRYLIKDWKNVPLTGIINLLAGCAPKIEGYGPGRNEYKMPVVNKTGIDYKIDILLKADFDDLEDTKRALREHGFDVVEDEVEATVMVISDRTDRVVAAR